MQKLKILIPFLVLLIFPAYILGISAAPSDISVDNCQPSAEGESVGFCTEVSATVQRSYYNGIVELPTRAFGVNIDSVNKLIGPFVIFLSALSYKFLNEKEKN